MNPFWVGASLTASMLSTDVDVDVDVDVDGSIN